ncbi:DsbG Protein-disulfide isomerase [Candidatus Nanopelagicaceae bacterium]
MATSSSGGDKVTRNLVIGMVALVVVVGASFSYFGSKGSTTAAIPASVSKTDGYGIVFNADVPNVPTIDIYEDFQCPVCARFAGINGITIEKAIEEKKAKVVFHTLSFLGTESVLAANAAACAADEDKFLAFHKAFFANQPAENAGAIDATFLKALGASIGIASDKFATCVDKGGYSDWVKNVAEAGSKANVNSTPTVFVNGKEIDRNTEYFNVEAFANAIKG